jgi:hypothetical protein
VSVAEAESEADGDELAVSVGAGVELSVTVGVGVGVSVGVDDALAEADGDADELAEAEADADAEAEAGADADAEAEAGADADEPGPLPAADEGAGVTVVVPGGDLRNSDSAGVSRALGLEAPADVAVVGRAPAPEAVEAGAGELAVPPACGLFGVGAGECAPVRTKTATADAATRAPLRPAEASGCESRCLPGRRSAWRGTACPVSLTTSAEVAASSSSAADWLAADP